MFKPSWGVKLGSAACVLISFTGLTWLVSLPRGSLLYNFEHLCAILPVMAAAILSWAILFASIGKERNWRLIHYRAAGFFLLVPGVAFYFLGGMPEVFFSLILSMCASAMIACPKVAFPNLYLSEIVEQSRRENEPLSLFPK